MYGYNVLFCLLGALSNTDTVTLITSQAALPQIYGGVLRANLSRTVKDWSLSWALNAIKAW